MKTSRPSATPGLPTKASPSTPSWTKPRPADVIHYRYLWRHEAQRGDEDGRKTRPCLVFATRETTRGLVVNIAPISTRQYDPKQMIALPDVVTAHLGLDSRSVIVTSEYNAFIWIGPDVFARDNGNVFYGAMPARLFERARDQLIANRRNLVVRTQ